jgi:general secretion pathway protein C
MWRRPKTDFNWRPASSWRPYAPRLVTGLLGILIAVDAAQTAWSLHVISQTQIPLQPLTIPKRDPAFDASLVVQAHLFGEPLVAAPLDAANAPETQLALSLSGVIATKDPNKGYAILGAADKPAHLYRIGASLQDVVPTGRLHQVFVDRVVLELGGHLQTVRLPHQGLSGITPGQTNVAETATAQSATAAADQSPDVITPAQGVFANLNVEQNNVDGQAAGLLMHPGKRFQREYGLKDSDVLTAVNGVEVTGTDDLARTLKTSAKALSLTVLRDGIPHTVKLPTTY